MRTKTIISAGLMICLLGVHSARAHEPDPADTRAQAAEPLNPAAQESEGAQSIIERALELIGVRYRRGGSSPQTGFDCSGLVNHVFREVHGMILPRSSRAISKTGQSVEKEELQSGDLVLFHNLRKTVTHIGIYIGDNKFVHSPKPGQKVSIADLRERYWSRRYYGARRIEGS